MATTGLKIGALTQKERPYAPQSQTPGVNQVKWYKHRAFATTRFILYIHQFSNVFHCQESKENL